MKRLLSMILALMLVCALTAGVAVMADEMELSEEEMQALMEQLGGEEAVTEQPAQPELPADYDESTIKQYVIYNFTDLEKIAVKVYMTANEGTLKYMYDTYTSYGQPVTEGEYDGNKALILGDVEMTLEDALNGSDFVYLDKEGLFANTKMIIFPFGTMLQNGAPEGTNIATLVIENGKDSETHEIIAGENNTFVYEIKEYNWFNIIIAAMILVVLILIVVIILVVVKVAKKKSSKNDDDEYIEELDDLIEDEEVIEEVIEEEIAEEETEETNE